MLGIDGLNNSNNNPTLFDDAVQECPLIPELWGEVSKWCDTNTQFSLSLASRNIRREVIINDNNLGEKRTKIVYSKIKEILDSKEPLTQRSYHWITSFVLKNVGYDEAREVMDEVMDRVDDKTKGSLLQSYLEKLILQGNFQNAETMLDELLSLIQTLDEVDQLDQLKKLVENIFFKYSNIASTERIIDKIKSRETRLSLLFRLVNHRKINEEAKNVIRKMAKEIKTIPISETQYYTFSNTYLEVPKKWKETLTLAQLQHASEDHEEVQKSLSEAKQITFDNWTDPFAQCVMLIDIAKVYFFTRG